MSAFNPQQPQNPYAAPAEMYRMDAAPPAPATPGMLAALEGTRPWVVFLAVLAFIGGGFMVLGGLAMMGMGAFMPRGAGAAGGGAFAALAGVMYLVFAGVYIFVGAKQIAYSNSIQEVLTQRDLPSVERALERQRSLWQAFGIMAIGAFVLIGLALVGGMVAGILGAARARAEAAPSAITAPNA